MARRTAAPNLRDRPFGVRLAETFPSATAFNLRRDKLATPADASAPSWNSAGAIVRWLSRSVSFGGKSAASFG
jgi:hypothetical protein